MFESELAKRDWEVAEIKFFTAIARGPDASARHKTYIRALETRDKIIVVYGKHMWENFECQVAQCAHGGDRRFELSEEKQTDVNLSVSMVADAYEKKCDIQLLVSGDSDYVGAVKHIRSLDSAPHVLALVPSLGGEIDTRGTRASNELRESCHGDNDLPFYWLVNHQFNESVSRADGSEIRIPRTWRIARMPEVKEQLRQLRSRRS